MELLLDAGLGLVHVEPLSERAESSSGCVYVFGLAPVHKLDVLGGGGLVGGSPGGQEIPVDLEPYSVGDVQMIEPPRERLAP